jgi:hypothetical protein
LNRAKSVHDVASLLKLYLTELPEPILTFDLLDCFILAIGKNELHLEQFEKNNSQLLLLNQFQT